MTHLKGGDQTMKKYIEILREFFLKKCLVWGDPRAVICGNRGSSAARIFVALPGSVSGLGWVGWGVKGEEK